MMTKPMLQVVLDELQARKGTWRDLARYMEPTAQDSYYSWLTKLATGTIREPSVNKIQRLYDYFFRGAEAVAGGVGTDKDSLTADGPARAVAAAKAADRRAGNPNRRRRQRRAPGELDFNPPPVQVSLDLDGGVPTDQPPEAA